MKKKENPKKSNTTGTITERGVENKSKTGIGRIIRGEKGETKGRLLTYIILITYAGCSIFGFKYRHC